MSSRAGLVEDQIEDVAETASRSPGVRAKAVVITGASTGIGADCALRMDGLGWRVFAGVRNEEDGARLQSCASERLVPIALDVTNHEQVVSARDEVADALGSGGLGGLVNNAGIGCGGPLEFVDLDDVRQLFEINVFGVIRTTQAFLPLLRTGEGRVVNISSVSGRISFPFVGPYAASKHALEALSDAQRVELRPWGIHVSVVEPGNVDTPIWQKSLEALREARDAYPPTAHQLYGPVFGLSERVGRKVAPTKGVSDAIERALLSSRPRARYLVGSDARLGALLSALPTGLRDRIIAARLPKYP